MLPPVYRERERERFFLCICFCSGESRVVEDVFWRHKDGHCGTHLHESSCERIHSSSLHSFAFSNLLWFDVVYPKVRQRWWWSALIVTAMAVHLGILWDLQRGKLGAPNYTNLWWWTYFEEATMTIILEIWYNQRLWGHSSISINQTTSQRRTSMKIAQLMRSCTVPSHPLRMSWWSLVKTLTAHSDLRISRATMQVLS